MALVSDLIAIGLGRRIAEALGFDFESVLATGSSHADAQPITASLVRVSSGGVDNRGITLPTLSASKAKMHIIFTLQAGTPNPIKIYASGDEQFLGAGPQLPIILEANTATLVHSLPLSYGNVWLAVKFDLNLSPL